MPWRLPPPLRRKPPLPTAHNGLAPAPAARTIGSLHCGSLLWPATQANTTSATIWVTAAAIPAAAGGSGPAVLDSLVTVISGAWWSYPLIAFLAAFDSILPLLPSETAVVTAGIIAAHGGLLLPVVLLAAAAGAFAGDNLAYWIGRKGQRTARRWLLRGDKGQRAISWAARTLDRHGGSVLVVGRFIPGGRTAITVGSGIASFPWRRFAAYDAVGAVTWATVNSVIGYVGGKAFEHQTWLAFLVSFAAAVLVGAVVELVRWAVARRRTGRKGAAAASRGQAAQDAAARGRN